MKRRSFLERMLLFSGGLVLSGSYTAALATPSKLTIKGRVTAGAKKLANVVVSDGYSVVKTNRKGKYELPVNGEARFVWISVPAGYDFPNKNGIARHYQYLDHSSKQDYNFELKALPTDDTKHSFIIWADPQPRNKKDAQRMLDESVPDVQKTLAGMATGTLVHGITVGDITWDNPDLYKEYDQGVATMGVPFFQVLGNHDQDLNKGGDEVSDKTFEATYGPTYYSFNRGKLHYVVMDDVRYLGKDKQYDGYITEHQLKWLKKDLAMVPTDNLVILCAHIPIHWGVKNREELYPILKNHKVHIMTGHTHYNRNVIEQDIFEHNHGTVCGNLWTGPVCGDGAPGGYAVYEANGTDLKWYYKSTGFDADHQMTIYMQPAEEQQQRMLVNVWNWDPEWKVEWWADNQYKGTLQNIISYDPIAWELYQGDQLPKGRTYVEPRETEHFFEAFVPATVKELKVVATDRFGRKYENRKAVS
ncbi:calcineurin-like phosphoesterase C-terminal domain-containing protein [Pontibacter sp. BT310]|uniref:Calcineurin-like phosphoesterase family protein n=1 Tax=Pontibacter populi TaxID=890055 RepID=A0ABS6XGM5_9BACT|nr:MULTISPECIES: calcineurin-like phosphoesterase family protein [Pontibacter]MBJ6119422.1 calcineurin-like phosphoesterase C-terminal domain-containing protein [Pontibacter sp. BT310]MBR0571850.1 calcineurin-like phosphoesterase C-terminal domain-containing protein [Microvirga sp. STS03]MBW3366276.1 calcineurin-like phosphoesterase family protein [Pontibacter populi]